MTKHTRKPAATATSADTLWSVPTRAAAAAVTVVGAVMIAVAAAQARTTTDLDTQADHAGLATLGLAWIALAALVWVLLGQRTLRIARRQALAPLLHARSTASHRPAPIVSNELGFLATERMGRFHRPGCLLLAGKVAESNSWAAHLRAGRTPCEVCVVDE